MSKDIKNNAEKGQEVLEFIRNNSLLYAATMGLDKEPKVYPAQLCFEEDGALYFACPKCEMFYGELSMHPFVCLCACSIDGTVLRITGNAVFTEDEGIVSRCIESSPFLKEKWGAQPDMLIAYFLKDMSAEFTSLRNSDQRTISLGTPGSALVGISIKKDTELRDRIIKIMERREAEGPMPTEEAMAVLDADALYAQRLYDGALMYFAETAKALWKRMDIGPIQRCALFETYDQLEEFTGFAKRLIGNATIDKPEDLTYWLNKETLLELKKKTEQ